MQFTHITQILNNHSIDKSDKYLLNNNNTQILN